MVPSDPDRSGTAGDDDLEPEFPDEAGVEVPRLPIEKVESERLLDNEVRARLESDGFSDDQILRWVEAYFAEHDEGEADDVVAWIREQEARRPWRSGDRGWRPHQPDAVMERVLVGYDDSPAARSALDWAIEHIRRDDGELVVAYVVVGGARVGARRPAGQPGPHPPRVRAWTPRRLDGGSPRRRRAVPDAAAHRPARRRAAGLRPRRGRLADRGGDDRAAHARRAAARQHHPPPPPPRRSTDRRRAHRLAARRVGLTVCPTPPSRPTAW